MVTMILSMNVIYRVLVGIASADIPRPGAPPLAVGSDFFFRVAAISDRGGVSHLLLTLKPGPEGLVEKPQFWLEPAVSGHCEELSDAAISLNLGQDRKA
jgi:hypothetical protein